MPNWSTLHCLLLLTLSHVSCFIQGKVIEIQVLLDSLHPLSTRASWWSPPVLHGEAAKILASVSQGLATQNV